MGKNKDKICVECEPECNIDGRRWAEHCQTKHAKKSYLVKYRYQALDSLPLQQNNIYNQVCLERQRNQLVDQSQSQPPLTSQIINVNTFEQSSINNCFKIPLSKHEIVIQDLWKQLQAFEQENRELWTSSTRSRSVDSKFTDGNLGSANSAGEFNLKREIAEINASLHERCDQMITTLKEQLMETKDQHRVAFEFQQKQHNIDVATFKEKYEYIMREKEITVQELKQQLYDKDLLLQTKEQEWLNMFKELYNLSKNSNFHEKLKGELESINNSFVESQIMSPLIQSPFVQSPRHAQQSTKIQQIQPQQQNSVQIVHTQKHLGYSDLTFIKESLKQWGSKVLGKRSKRTPIVRTPNGSNLQLKQLRKAQSAFIIKTLDGMKHLLPTIQEILTSLWDQSPILMKVKLKSLGLALPFCDGIRIPKTRITQTDAQVRALFQSHDLQLFTVIIKDSCWFVKLDEDAMPDFNHLRLKLRALSDSAHEQLRGEADFFFQQIDQTSEFGGFLYAQKHKELINALGVLGLKQQRGYHSNSLSLNLNAGKNRRLKIYNKTIHPLFAPESVSKRIGMGGKQFFQSSHFFHSKVKAADQVGRLRIELSHSFKTKVEEQQWFESVLLDDLPQKVLYWLRNNGNQWIKEISFEDMWKAFWYNQQAHIFVEETLKAAIVYAYNEETRQYIGGLLDVTQKKDFDLFHKEHSIVNREALVVQQGIVVQKFIKQDNKHCYPIFPRFNPKSNWTHPFSIAGWNYYMNCREVVLQHSVVPIRSSEVLDSGNEHSRDSVIQDLLSRDSDELFGRVKTTSKQNSFTQIQDIDCIQQSQLEQGAPVYSSPLPNYNIIMNNFKSSFIEREQQQHMAKIKRKQKEEVKRIEKAAKENKRANRDEDMDFFVSYYKEKYSTVGFVKFKKLISHPIRIQNLLNNPNYIRKIQQFIGNKRRCEDS